MPGQTYTIRRRLLSLPFAAALLTLAAAPAWAQNAAADIPVGTAQSLSLDAAEQQQIQTYIDAYAPALLEGPGIARVRARDGLIRPLNLADVSIVFRQAYSDGLEAHLQTLLADADAGATLTGLRLAGELATEDAVALIVPFTQSEDDGIRLFAISRLERVFDVVAARSPSLSPSTANNLVLALGDALATEENVTVADAGIRALLSASNIKRPNFEALRFQAVTQMTTNASVRLRNANPDDLAELLLAVRACGGARDALIDVTASPTDEACSAAVGLAGDVIAYLFAQMQNESLPPVGQRSTQIQAINAAESALYHARRVSAEINGQPAPKLTTLERSFTSGDDRAFRFEVVSLLGSNSQLIEDFDFEPKRFIP